MSLADVLSAVDDSGVVTGPLGEPEVGAGRQQLVGGVA